MNVPAGQLLTEKGLTQREIFVILDGAFEVHDGDRRIAVLGPGEVIGEVGFFGTSGRRMASVTAASDGQVLVAAPSVRRRADEKRSGLRRRGPVRAGAGARRPPVRPGVLRALAK